MSAVGSLGGRNPARRLVLQGPHGRDRPALPDHHPATRVLRLGGAEELVDRPGQARLGADHRRRRTSAGKAGARDLERARLAAPGARLLHPARERLRRRGDPPLRLVDRQGRAAIPQGQGALPEPPRARRPGDRGPGAGARQFLPALHLPHLRSVLPEVPQLRRVGRGAGLPRRPQGGSARARFPPLVAVLPHLRAAARVPRRHARPDPLQPAVLRRLLEVRPPVGIQHPPGARRGSQLAGVRRGRADLEASARRLRRAPTS